VPSSPTWEGIGNSPDEFAAAIKSEILPESKRIDAGCVMSYPLFAVVNGYERSAALPNVLTTAEAGLADAEFPIWFGLFAPAQTPRGIVEKLHYETLKAQQTADVKDKLAGLAVDPMTMTTDQFAAFVEKEVAANAALVKMAGIKAQAD